MAYKQAHPGFIEGDKECLLQLLVLQTGKKRFHG
jgi:hypothetical protein